ncbi:hypothetical protein AB0J43_48550, partial [Nonomuraea fuscirosea]
AFLRGLGGGAVEPRLEVLATWRSGGFLYVATGSPDTETRSGPSSSTASTCITLLHTPGPKGSVTGLTPLCHPGSATMAIARA